MRSFDIVIIGGGPAGVTAAISASNTYPEKSIALIRKEKTPMIPCGIPYIIHSLKSIEDNILPDVPLKKRNVELIIDEVVDKKGKTLILASGEEIQYQKLVLATGSVPFVPPIKGIDKEGVFFVKKNKDYLEKLREAIERASKIVIIGGGFIGLEVADELLRKGKKLIIVEKLEHLLPLAMDPEFGEMVKEILKEKGAEIRTSTTVEEIYGQDKAEGVVFTSGERIDADMIIVSAGYRPNIELAKKFGLEYNERYGIIVDEYLRTSDEDIFAVGDCAAKRNCFTGEFSKIMLASTAMAEGRLAGSNLFAIKVIRKFVGVLGSFSTKIGDVAFGVSGLTERDAKALGVDYVVGAAETVDRHPGKLPGASKIYVKLIFSRYSHTLLGGEVKGGNSVGEIVNLLASMIQNKMTDMEIDTLQIGTHPLLTPSPIAYPIINATADAIVKWYRGS